MSRVYSCEICDDADPHWSLLRRGDVVVSWACDADLAQVAARLQRDNEVTELVVTDHRKAGEWAGISRALDGIAGTPPPKRNPREDLDGRVQ